MSLLDYCICGISHKPALSTCLHRVLFMSQSKISSFYKRRRQSDTDTVQVDWSIKPKPRKTGSGVENLEESDPFSTALNQEGNSLVEL